MGEHHPRMNWERFISWHCNSIMDEGHVQYTSQYQDILAEESMAASMWYLHCCENITDKQYDLCVNALYFTIFSCIRFSWMAPQHIMLQQIYPVWNRHSQRNRMLQLRPCHCTLDAANLKFLKDIFPTADWTWCLFMQPGVFPVLCNNLCIMTTFSCLQHQSS